MERFLKAGKRLVNLGNTNFIDLGKPNQVVFLMVVEKMFKNILIH